jgi:hypothetical protein
MVSWFAAHFTMALHAVLYPVYVSCTADVNLRNDASLRRGFRVFRERWRTYAYLGTLKILLQMIVPEALAIGLLALVGVAADHMSGENPLMDPMMWIFVGVFLVFAYYVVLWFWPRLAFSFPACVAESLPARAALHRSFHLARERRWSIVLVWAAVWMANSIAWYVLRNVLWWAMYLVFHGNVFGTVPLRLFPTLLYGSWWVIGTLLAPVFPIALTLFYYDQRIRKEGFDIEWMMQSAGMTEPATAAPATAGSAAPVDASVPVEEAGE